MPSQNTSVLLPSYRRPQALERCLRGLADQSVLPGEVLVVWQAEDAPTRAAAEALAGQMPFPLRVLHGPVAGIVDSQNLALEAARGDVIFLIDDDAVAPPTWITSHLRHYRDRAVGAVGGPIVNFLPDGTPFPKRNAEPIGAVTWYGKILGNMFDHVKEWESRLPRSVRHLAGGNMSLRRSAFERFEPALKPYWQLFELDACLQVQARGYRVLFDFANPVQHSPTCLAAYTDDRDGDLGIKIHNAGYNHAFVLSKHSRWPSRLWRFLYLLLIGSVGMPGLLASLKAMRRYGRPERERKILWQSWHSKLTGWRAGARRRIRFIPRSQALPGNARPEAPPRWRE